jgi:cell wall-associated NlpC family hydrolase
MGRRELIATAALALVLAGCGSAAAGGAGSGSDATSRAAATTTTTTTHATTGAHPQAVEPVAGAAATVTSASDASLPHPESISDIRHQLAASGMTARTDQATLTSDGLAIAPVGAPEQVQEIIDAGNEIAHLPYIWGGGHMTYEDTGYDCSGSLSYVLAAAGLLDGTMTSGQLESWGKPGPGKWITVFATDGHTFMYVAGLRFDTVALAETGTRWSASAADEPDLGSFVERHPAGL